MQNLDAMSKMTEWSLFVSKANYSIYNNPSLCPDHWFQRSWSWTVLWRPTRPSTTNTKKRCPFHHSGRKCKSRKSWDTWSSNQVWFWSTKWSTAKAIGVVSREHTGHNKHSSNNTREDSTHGHHHIINNEIRLIIFSAVKDGEALYSQQKQDQELILAQVMNSLLPNSDLNWR